MLQLAKEGDAALQAGQSALDTVEQLVRSMEASGLYVAGKGSHPNSAGYVELDAAIMCGETRRAGAVAAIRDVVHPIAAARRVMEATPHVLLTGNGATLFALKQGLEAVGDPSRYYQPISRTSASPPTIPAGANPKELQHGTVGVAALDVHGHLAAATSTGGVFGKLEGRVGDSPIIGAGTWADDLVAVSCTGKGEYFMRVAAAHQISARLRYRGQSLESAVHEVLQEVRELGGEGGVIAVSKSGEMVLAFNTAGMKRAAVKPGEAAWSATF